MATVNQSNSANWLFNMVGSRLKNKVPMNAFSQRTDVFIGGVFVYGYDPKTKEKLPYYDTLPVIIPVDFTNDGWYGLNLHYLHPTLRRQLFKQLKRYKQNARSPNAYMKLSYEFLISLGNTKQFSNCFKRYLTTHLTTPILKVEEQHWENVIMLPLQQFKKSTASDVWRRR